ncbi:nicotinamide-nucleotide amidohydrolase family protein [Paracoccus sp. MBLB3053]|uniref:Nicotinamide-nucleotide amidohydrolase family protein n=1 Tax=Paracoccus aurantius TaxID=3073814 RepID=A0ABU2HYR7_9RHOB|nr:nicotinamide-nucleotide amidohydrolase family protein [Paracoccus sp. MBLB3053]MDS9470193.1 nicotinamide-nucleotide amidohydrolase family protein [Paracoccus sp. MBLB3053]
MQDISRRDLSIPTAESCTGGAVATLLADVEGVSHAFDSGFVTYSDDAKARYLGVDAQLIAEHGTVSREVPVAMADGALQRSGASFALSVTGFAGATEEGREGELHFALAARQDGTVERHEEFGPLGRRLIRELCMRVLLSSTGSVFALQRKACGLISQFPLTRHAFRHFAKDGPGREFAPFHSRAE